VPDDQDVLGRLARALAARAPPRSG
jgi:hypothetical protein